MNGKKDLAVLFMRIVLGLIFLMHGMDKLFGIAGGSIDGLSGMLAEMGFAPSLLWAWSLAVTEALAGLFLVLGVLPRLSAFSISVIMLVAIIAVHGPQGFFYKSGGMEYSLLIFATSVYFIFCGGGKYSLFDKM